MLNIMHEPSECEGILMPGEHTVSVQPRDERLMLKTCEKILYRHQLQNYYRQPTRNWHQLPGCYTQALERYNRFLHAEKRL